MVDPQALNGVKQVPEPLSPKYRNRVPKLSNRSRSHSVKYVPGSYICPSVSGRGMDAGWIVRRRGPGPSRTPPDLGLCRWG